MITILTMSFVFKVIKGNVHYKIAHSIKSSLNIQKTFVYGLPLSRKNMDLRYITIMRMTRTPHSLTKLFSIPSRELPLHPYMLLILGFLLTGDEKVEDDIITMIKYAKLAEMKTDFASASDYYHKALALVQSLKDVPNTAEHRLEMTIYLYDHMGNAALAQGNLESAEKLFKELIKGLLQQNKSKVDTAIIEVSLKLAMIYAMQQRYDDAEDGYVYCLTNQEHLVKEKEGQADITNDMALLGMCANSYARFLMLRNRLVEAQQQMHRALDIAKLSLGEKSVQVAVLYNDVATLATLQGKYEEALLNVKKAIEVAEAVESPDLAVFFCNLGEISLKMGNINLAKQYCKTALNLAKKSQYNYGRAEAEQCLKACVNK